MRTSMGSPRRAFALNLDSCGHRLQPPSRQADSLTPRELDVLRSMAAAKETAAMAADLGISVNTARGYVQGVLEKLQAHSRLEAVIKAQELGILG